jgi:penicillin G amidase
VSLEVWVTNHGPVICGSPESGAALAFQYTATDGPSAWPDSLGPMLRAKDCHELIESMREWVDPVNNFLLADVHGNIGYLCRGEVPIRSRQNAHLPVPGWTGEHEW